MQSKIILSKYKKQFQDYLFSAIKSQIHVIVDNHNIIKDMHNDRYCMSLISYESQCSFK